MTSKRDRLLFVHHLNVSWLSYLRFDTPLWGRQMRCLEIKNPRGPSASI